MWYIPTEKKTGNNKNNKIKIKRSDSLISILKKAIPPSRKDY